MASLLDSVTNLLPDIVATRRGRLKAYAALAGLGAIMCFVAFLMVFSYARLMTTGQRATAEVIGQEQLSQASGSVRVPVLRYSTPGGRFHTVTYRYATSPGTIGTRLTVVFDPSRPYRFEVVGHIGPWIFSAQVAGLGVLTMIVAGGLFITTYRQEDEAMRLNRIGRRVQARILRINTTVMPAGPPLCDIDAEWQDPATGETLRFRSKEVNGDPALLGGTVAVIFDPADATRYHLQSDQITIR